MTGAPRYEVVEWSGLRRWDFKSARAAAFRAAHPTFRPLGDFIEDATELVYPAKEPAHVWPVYGVSNRVGVTQSHAQNGSEFNSPYKRIKKDWFFHNPTRANVGSLGRVPDVPPDAITSPEYQVWKIRQGLLPEFLEILIRLPFFLGLIQVHRVGAVKERLFFENLCEIPIPAVPEDVQRRIVGIWNGARKKARDAEEKVRAHESELERRFFDDLGVTPSVRDSLGRPKALAVNWAQLERFSIEATIDAVQELASVKSTKYTCVHLGSVASVSYGIQKSPANRPGLHPRPYLRVANVRKGYLDLSEVKEINVSDGEMPAYRLEPGDILFVEGNGSRSELGRVAKWDGEIPNCVHQNHLIKVRADKKSLLPDFAVTWFNTDFGRAHFFRSAKSSSGLGTINSSEVRGAPIPLPPLAEQVRIMKHVASVQADIERERQAAKMLLESIGDKVQSLVLGLN